MRHLAIQAGDNNEQGDVLDYFCDVGMTAWLMNASIDSDAADSRTAPSHYVNKAIVNTVANMLEGDNDYEHST